MGGKLNKDEILSEMLTVLVRGWGVKAVRSALKAFEPESGVEDSDQVSVASETETDAVKIALNSSDLGDSRDLIIELAKAFDGGHAFPKNSDVKSFLAANGKHVKDIRSRNHAFRLLLPVIIRMSEKGLLRLLANSHYSGPTQLGLISEAIEDTGNSFRGNRRGSHDETD